MKKTPPPRRPARKKASGRSRSPRRSRFQGWRRRVLIGIAGAFVALFLFVGLLYAFADVPEPTSLAAAQSVRVVDPSNRDIGRIHAAADRVSIPLEDMPEHLRQAVIATEDRTYYSHPGVSIGAVVRAAVVNLVGRGIEQGGSTLTQQYVKNAFVGREKTFLRKAREAVLALKLERRNSKDEILALYLNTIYWGRGAYGVEAAASAYFGKHARDLSLPESAFLAGVIHKPEAYDALDEPEKAKARRSEVLGLMVRDKYITEAEADKARGADLNVRRRRAGGLAPHYLEEVRKFLEKEIGPDELYGGGITVTGTVDVAMQRAAEKAVAEVYDRATDPEAALVAIDPKTGAVRAMVGSRDFAKRELNLAMRRRQPGSTFKPVVLSAAVNDGMSIEKKYPAPAKVTLDTESGPWPVSTYDRRGHGMIDLSRATELSVNTVYARLILDVGPEKVVDEARELGVRSKLDGVPALTLGTEEVTPYELASAYATWAARGERRDPYLVEKVTGKEGKVLFRAEREAEQTIEENTADTVNLVLRRVIERGTGRAASFGRPAAGKTGTTEDFRDAWFAGYTPDLACVVWNGFPGDNKKLRDIRGRNVTGGSFPAQMWNLFMSEAHKGIPVSDFVQPKIEGDDSSPTATASPSETRTPTETPTTPGPISTQTRPAPPKPSPTATSPKPSPTKTTASPSPSPTASTAEGG